MIDLQKAAEEVAPVQMGVYTLKLESIINEAKRIHFEFVIVGSEKKVVYNVPKTSRKALVSKLIPLLTAMDYTFEGVEFNSDDLLGRTVDANVNVYSGVNFIQSFCNA